MKAAMVLVALVLQGCGSGPPPEPQRPSVPEAPLIAEGIRAALDPASGRILPDRPCVSVRAFDPEPTILEKLEATGRPVRARSACDRMLGTPHAPSDLLDVTDVRISGDTASVALEWSNLASPRTVRGSCRYRFERRAEGWERTSVTGECWSA